MLLTTILLFAILAFFQKLKSRQFVGWVLFSTESAHYLLFNEADGLLYYGSAGLFDLLTVLVIAKLAIPTRLAAQILSISMISIVINYVGFAIWLAYVSPVFYNWSFAFLNLFTIICLIMREPGDVAGRNAGDCGNSILWGNDKFCRQLSTKLQAKT